MNLLFCINKLCVNLLINCMCSIDDNGGFTSYDAYILHSDLEKGDFDAINEASPSSFRIHFIDVPDGLFDGFPTTKRYPKQIYYRLAAAQLLPKHVDRILYMDVDTIVINSLAELYNSDFESNIFIATTHVKKVLSMVNQIRLGIKDGVPYVNTGVMMLNLPLMRADVRMSDIREYALRYKNVLMLPDQDILTALYGEKVKIVDAMRYNISDRDISLNNSMASKPKIDLEWVRVNSTIIHFYGRNKPWKKSYRGILKTLYLEQLSRNDERKKHRT